jgi:hypothetical protein
MGNPANVPQLQENPASLLVNCFGDEFPAFGLFG